MFSILVLYLLTSNCLSKETSNILLDQNLVFYAYYNNTLIHATKNNLTSLLNLVKPKSEPSPMSVKKIHKRDTISLLNDRLGDQTTYQIIGPRCIPLKGNNINSNPYHPGLLSFPGAEVRRGQGVTSRQEISHIRCPKDHQSNCRYSYQQSDSTTVTDSFSVSLSSSDSFSKSVGTSKSTGSSNSYSKSIGKSIENSISKSITLTDDVTLSKTISESLSKNHEKSSGLTKSKSTEKSDSNSISHETNEANTLSSEVSLSKSLSNEVSKSSSQGGSSSSSSSSSTESSSSHSAGANAGVGIGPFSIGGNYNYARSSGSSNSNTATSESNWSNQYSNTQGSSETNSKSESSSKTLSLTKGSTNSITSSYSDSASEENRVSDSISVTRDASRGLTKSTSDSKSDSTSESNSYRIDDSYTSSEETSISGTLSNDQSKSETKSEEKSRSTSYTFTINQDTEFGGIAPGSCKTAICLPFVKSIVIPYECLSDAGEHDLIPVEYMFIESNQANRAQCVFTLIDCNMRYENVFINDRREYQSANKNNSLEYGQIVEKGFRIESNNQKFTLELLNDGNLVLKQFDKIVWENGMGFFEKYKYLRLRINEKGHLIEEVQNLFKNADENYRRNEWITVWSSAPLNHNVTIGVPGLQGKREGYKLILDDYGDLSLYDSFEVMIWTATKANRHSKGYKFPEVYLLPTNFETPQDKDEHNSIESTVALLDQNKLMSLDSDCKNELKQNQGLQSPNKRFKLIMRQNGNLILKDGFRTMWQTSTKNLPYAKAPYKLVINPTGNIMILDSNSNILWASVINNMIKYEKIVTGPFTLELMNQGKLILRDKYNQTIWDSWPTSQNSLGSVFLVRMNYYYDKCAPSIKCDIRQYHWTKRMNNKCLDLLKYNSSSSNFEGLKNAFSFEIIRKDDSIFYFLVDRFNGKIIKYNNKFEMIKSIDVKNPNYITSSNDFVFVNVNKKIISKYDLDLNEIKKVEVCSPSLNDSMCELNGLFYDKLSEKLYVSNTKQISVHVYDNDLNSLGDFAESKYLKSIKNFKPRYISLIKNQLILSSLSTNAILFYDDKNEIKVYKNVCNDVVNSIKSIQMYQNKYILTSCTNENQVNVYDLKFNKLPKVFQVSQGEHVIKLDTDGSRLIALTNKNKLEFFE